MSRFPGLRRNALGGDLLQVEHRDRDAMERRIARLRLLDVDDLKLRMLGQPLRDALAKAISVLEHRRGKDLHPVERISWMRSWRRPNHHLAIVARPGSATATLDRAERPCAANQR